jgi:hypothetical protein
MTATLACPYCYETFTAREIMFRCNGRLSRAGRRCELRQDPILGARRPSERRELGPVFTADGRASRAPCPECGSDTTYRICPVCHSLLPVQFGVVGSRMISMAGAKDSGKTVFMAVLLHELRNRIGEQYSASIMGADDETLKRFAARYEDELYVRGQMFPSTQGAGQNDGRVDPLVFRFAATPGSLLASRPEHTLLSFFDTAGEDFLTQDSVDVNTRYLARGDGILLLLDPLQMLGARDLAVPGTPLPDIGPAHESPSHILTRVTNILLAQPGRRRRKSQIDKPIAVVFTKIDALWHAFDPGSPLRAQPPAGSRFDVADSLDVHEEIRHLLRSWQGGQINETLRAYYPRHRFFGVSALGGAPTPDNAVGPRGIQPYRVADPLLWMLSEFGAIPRVTPGSRLRLGPVPR